MRVKGRDDVRVVRIDFSEKMTFSEARGKEWIAGSWWSGLGWGCEQKVQPELACC